MHEIDEILSQKKHNQPILILFDNQQIFLKLDHQYCLINSNSITYAIDLLFKSFWTFNVKYPDEASYFYYFVELIFGIKDNKKPVLIEFMSRFES